ncbi:MAG TPA: tRNA lysidine(34) synthetase TilS [Ktedonobacterales bacterium]
MAADARSLVERAVTRAVRRYGLWSPGAGLVVAVSGGADSLCLLGTLLALREHGHRQAPGELIVAHFDHGLRGEESHEDARYVQRLASELGVPSVIGQPETPYAPQVSGSIEAWARRERYAFLRRILGEQQAERIVTGHTRDDQAETILLHWLRGSGLTGMRGMAPLRADIARPMLDVTHEQTLAYCAAQGWQPREDITNIDPRFLRNRIRHELLPLLATYNPGIRDLLIRNSELLVADEDYLESQAQAAWADVAERATTESVRLRREPLSELPAALRHRVYRAAARQLIGPDISLEARHIAALDNCVARGHTGDVLHLVGGMTTHLAYDTLVFQKAAGAIPAPHRRRSSESESPTWRLPIPGVVEMPALGWRIRAWRTEGVPGSEDNGALPTAPGLASLAFADRPAELGRAESRVYLDAEATGDTLSVRAWQPGDRFRPLGLDGEKKLQDYFSDAKVPRELRARVPLVFNARHLVWVAGLRIDDRVRLTPTTGVVVVLQLEPLTGPEFGENNQ